MSYIKSPLNYVGGKFKLLPRILPLFPDNIHTFYDLFGGGGNVCVNVKADKIVYNDLSIQVVQLLEAFKRAETEELLSEIDNYIKEYNLNKTNKDGYLRLRRFYNEQNKSPIVLYVLLCHAFNNQIRFNAKGGFNTPFGLRSFTQSLRQKFTRFCDNLHSVDISFCNSDFREFRDVRFEPNDFVYCDPPYLNTVVSYTESGGWSETDENDLRSMLEYFNATGVKFALSNNLAVNCTLEDWAEKNRFVIHKIAANYKNCNYQKKNKQTSDREVLVTNY